MMFSRRIALALLTTVALPLPLMAQDDSPRILVLGGSVAEIIDRLGASDRLIGRDTTTTYPPDLLTLPDVGYLRALSPEGILSVEPDMILAEADAGPIETVELMESAEIPWLTMPNAIDAAGVLDKITAVGEALGLQDEAAALSAEVSAQLDEVTALAAAIPDDERPRVLFVLSTQGGRIMAAGTDTSAEGIIELAGGVNAVSDFSGYKQVTDEAVSAAAPDVILMMDREGDHGMAAADLFALPAMAPTPAAAEQRLIQMDGMLLLGFGPRTGEAALSLHDALFAENHGG